MLMDSYMDTLVLEEKEFVMITKTKLFVHKISSVFANYIVIRHAKNACKHNSSHTYKTLIRKNLYIARVKVAHSGYYYFFSSLIISHKERDISHE